MFLTKSAAKDPQVKVIDFGYAKYFNSFEDDMMTSRAGTPYYMAPEILEG
jgi:calcium-dependent protein kinase